VDAYEFTPYNLASGWAEAFVSAGFRPLSFWTFTFEREGRGFDGARYERVALGCFRWWVRQVNIRAVGPKFRRKFKHSFFSYLVAVDRHKDGYLHLHAVVDGFIEYRAGRDLWLSRYGFSYVSTIDGSEDARVALAHISKYARKTENDAADVDWWICRKPLRTPYLFPADSAMRADFNFSQNPYLMAEWGVVSAGGL